MFSEKHGFNLLEAHFIDLHVHSATKELFAGAVERLWEVGQEAEKRGAQNPYAPLSLLGINKNYSDGNNLEKLRQLFINGTMENLLKQYKLSNGQINSQLFSKSNPTKDTFTPSAGQIDGKDKKNYIEKASQFLKDIQYDPDMTIKIVHYDLGDDGTAIYHDKGSKTDIKIETKNGEIVSNHELFIPEGTELKVVNQNALVLIPTNSEKLTKSILGSNIESPFFLITGRVTSPASREKGPQLSMTLYSLNDDKFSNRTSSSEKYAIDNLLGKVKS